MRHHSHLFHRFPHSFELSELRGISRNRCVIVYLSYSSDSVHPSHAQRSAASPQIPISQRVSPRTADIPPKVQVHLSDL